VHNALAKSLTPAFFFTVEDNSRQQRPSHLLGVGLDNKDGHKRITRAEQFSVVGGSEETHGQMTETLLKTMEDLNRKGKPLSETEPDELRDLIEKQHS